MSSKLSQRNNFTRANPYTDRHPCHQITCKTQTRRRESYRQCHPLSWFSLEVVFGAEDDCHSDVATRRKGNTMAHPSRSLISGEGPCLALPGSWGPGCRRQLKQCISVQFLIFSHANDA